MKIILTMILVLLISCTTTNMTVSNNVSEPSKNEGHITVDDKIDLLLSQWEEAIRNGDRNLFSDLFFENGSMGYVDHKGKRIELKNIEAITELRIGFIRNFDPVASYKLPSPENTGLVDTNKYNSEF